MKTKIITLICGLMYLNGLAQSNVKKYFPTATFHKSNAKINGVSFGLLSGLNGKHLNTTSNGLRLELIGLGIGLPLIPRSPINEKDRLVKNSEVEFVEKINGLNISGSGTVCSDCLVNGVSLGSIGQYVYSSNGITVSLLMNLVDKQNGLQLAIFNESHWMNGVQIGFSNDAIEAKGLQLSLMGNFSNKTRGLQIGLFNKSKDFKGLQFGLWNVNQKRKMPLINWSFKG